MPYVIQSRHGIVIYIRDFSEVREVIQFSSTLFIVVAHRIYELVELIESGKFVRELTSHWHLFAATEEDN